MPALWLPWSRRLSPSPTAVRPGSGRPPSAPSPEPISPGRHWPRTPAPPGPARPRWGRALPLALAATGRAAGWGAWTGTAVAASGLAYLLPHLRPSRFGVLTRNASPFFYAVVLLSAIELRDAAIGTGRWQLPVALLVAAA